MQDGQFTVLYRTFQLLWFILSLPPPILSYPANRKSSPPLPFPRLPTPDLSICYKFDLWLFYYNGGVETTEISVWARPCNKMTCLHETPLQEKNNKLYGNNFNE